MSTSLEDEIREYTVQLDAAIDRRVAGRNRLTTLPARHPERISRRWLQRGLVAGVTVAAVGAAVIVVGVRHTAGDPIQVVDDVPGTDGTSPLTGAATDLSSTPLATTDLPSLPTTQSQPVGTLLPTTLEHPLDVGSTGLDVTRLQERLRDLGFVPGPVDGTFGRTTQQAVWAFEKLVLAVPRDLVTSAVTDDVWQQMQQPPMIVPRRSTGAGTTHVEIYLPEQVLAVFTDDRVALVAHISSGTGEEWCDTVTYDTDENGLALDAPAERAVCAIAKTPPGVFTISRSYVGKRIGPLGGMTNPVFFNYGIAISGAENVPLEPASHGGVRVDQVVAAVLPGFLHIGDQVFVWGDDGRQPEEYTRQESLPSFNYADPSASTQRPVDTAVLGTTTGMPLLTGLLRSVAEELLAERGVVAEVTFVDVPYSSPNDGRVVSQSVQVDTQVPAGSSVSLVVGRALPAPTTIVTASQP